MLQMQSDNESSTDLAEMPKEFDHADKTLAHKARRRANHSFRDGTALLFNKDKYTIKIKQEFPDNYEFYLSQYMTQFDKRLKTASTETLVIRLASTRGSGAATRDATLNESDLRKVAKEFAPHAEAYTRAYKESYAKKKQFLKDKAAGLTKRVSKKYQGEQVSTLDKFAIIDAPYVMPAKPLQTMPVMPIVLRPMIPSATVAFLPPKQGEAEKPEEFILIAKTVLTHLFDSKKRVLQKDKDTPGQKITDKPFAKPQEKLRRSV